MSKPVTKPAAKSTTKTLSKNGKRLKVDTKAKSNYEGLDAMLNDLADMRDRQKVLGADISEQQEKVLQEMDRLGIKSRTITKNGKQVLKATRSQNTSLVYDEPRLKKKLGAKLWDKVTTRRLDKAKLDAHLASGEIKVAVVAECATEKQTKPFITVR